MCVFMSIFYAGANGRQRREDNKPLKEKLHVVVSNHIWALVIKFTFALREVLI